MREILFRGKHTHMFSSNKPLDGMWCYGYLVDKNYINDKTDRGDGEYLGEMFVDPETVGQYTGMTDKNGTKIFEGDVVEFEHGGRVRAYVIYKDGSFEVKNDKADVLLYLYVTYHKAEVIGNKHDNPELMET